MYFNYFLIFSTTIVLAVFCTLAVKFLSKRFGIVDKPDSARKTHGVNIPLLGGAAIFLTFFAVLYFVRDKLVVGDLEYHHWLGVFVGACLLMIGGFLDDKYNLKPHWQVIWPILASLCVVLGGVNIEKITNPFGGFIYLGQFSAILIIFWLMGMMYTTKLLDGLDGLVTGVTVIGSFIIFLFTLTTKYYQPDIGLAALILAGACLGFLIFNWYPAKIFLGEGGSLFLGYVLGVLAIISGGKIAIALLVMGIPIMDVAWTIVRRLAAGRNPFKFADRKHLHFRLLDLGLSARKVVLLFYSFSFIFGLSALFLQSQGKMFVLLILAIIMFIIVAFFTYLDKGRKII